MDPSSSMQFPHSIDLSEPPIVITGQGCFSEEPGKSAKESLDGIAKSLRFPKMKKFMGKQDKMAVLSASEAIHHAAIPPEDLKERTGLYLSVGYIPFEKKDIEPLTQNSIENDLFEMELFSTKGIAQVNPLMTFRCLPNMPIFHVSLNFGIQGHYFITHPGPGQFYLALQEAIQDLRKRDCDFALIGGVADQNNFLVQHHFERTFNKEIEQETRQETEQNNPPEKEREKRPLTDASGFFCLERKEDAIKRNAPLLLELEEISIEYQPHDPLNQVFSFQETVFFPETQEQISPSDYLGPAGLPVLLSRFFQNQKKMVHQVNTLDGFKIRSQWKIPEQEQN